MQWLLGLFCEQPRRHLISKDCVLFSNIVIMVNDSHAYSNTDTTRERTSFILDPRDILLSRYIDFSFVRGAVACPILERIYGFKPPSETIDPKYWKLVTVPSFCHSTFISLWILLTLFVVSVAFSAHIFIL